MSETTTEAPEVASDAGADDLRSALGAAWDEVAAADTPAAPERDEAGRFAGQAKDEPEAEAEAPEVAATEPEPLPIPATLTGEDAAKWAELPRAAQEVIARREANAAKLAEEVQGVAPVREVLRKHEPKYAARGIPAAQALDALFSAQEMLETRPREAIEVLARQYGVDLRQFAPAATSPAYADPNLGPVMQEIQTLKATLAQQQELAARDAEATIHRTIQEFASKPDHPHFAEVRQLMGQLMQSGATDDMEAAYQMACRAHPEVYQRIVADETAKRAKAEAAERVKAAAAAKARAVSPRAAPTVNGFAVVPDSVRGALEAAWPT